MTLTNTMPPGALAPSPAPPRPAGPWWTLLTAVLSLGLWPLWRWSMMWQQFVRRDRPAQLARAAAARTSATEKQQRAIDRAVAKINRFPIIAAGPNFAFGVVALIAILMVLHRFPPHELWTLCFDPKGIHHWPMPQTAVKFHRAWVVLLWIGYGCQWLVVRRYVFATRALRSVMLPEAHRPSVGGPSIGWVLSAIVLCVLHAWWAIPMVLAGSIQRRHSIHYAGLLDVDSPVLFCIAPGCGARLALEARYCPRCGSNVARASRT